MLQTLTDEVLKTFRLKKIQLVNDSADLLPKKEEKSND